MHRVGVTHGLRGYFAVLYDQDGPIQSGVGSYETPDGAYREARDWAISEGIPYDSSPNPRMHNEKRIS